MTPEIRSMIDEIRGTLKSVAKRTGDERKDHRSNARWALAIKKELARLGHERGFDVFCSPSNETGAKWGEWLYDLCWLERKPKTAFYLRMPLAVELEWVPTMSRILPNFQKLVVSAADLCVMVWQNRSRKLLKRDAKTLRRQIKAAADDGARYILAGYDQRAEKFFYF